MATAAGAAPFQRLACHRRTDKAWNEVKDTQQMIERCNSCTNVAGESVKSVESVKPEAIAVTSVVNRNEQGIRTVCVGLKNKLLQRL